MANLSRNQVQEIIKDIENSITRTECLTCDCLQGLITQLQLDCTEDIADLIDHLKTLPEKMHGCLGCDPCPPGALFAQYLKSQNENIKK